jgi:DNA-binding NarL/FixJ family response regulator
MILKHRGDKIVTLLIEENPFAATKLLEILAAPDVTVHWQSSTYNVVAFNIQTSPVIILDRGTCLSRYGFRVRRLQSEFPQGKLILLDHNCAHGELESLNLRGISAFVPYASVEQKLLHTVRSVNGSRSIEDHRRTKTSTRASASQERVSHYRNLTSRQIQIVAYLQENASYTYIALRLGISHSTVKFHIKQLFRKYHVHDKFTLLQVLEFTRDTENVEGQAGPSFV